MKQIYRLLSVLLLLAVMLGTAVSCGSDEEPGDTHKDFAAELKLDMSSNTKKQEVTVKTYIDGDTTHFYLPQGSDVTADGVIKARYLAINTPESTGKIEEWGKAASIFTKETLQKATSIILESDTEKWNLDSTGD